MQLSWTDKRTQGNLRETLLSIKSEREGEISLEQRISYVKSSKIQTSLRKFNPSMHNNRN